MSQILKGFIETKKAPQRVGANNIFKQEVIINNSFSHKRNPVIITFFGDDKEQMLQDLAIGAEVEINYSTRGYEFTNKATGEVSHGVELQAYGIAVITRQSK